MKAAGSNTLAALASGQFFKAELYELNLGGSALLRFTDYDLPLRVSGATFASNVIVTRGAISQRVGLDPQTLDIDLAPQLDAPVLPTVSSLPLLQAAKLGLLDGARLKMWKVFMQKPTAVGQLATNTNNESVAWYSGVVADVDVGRQSVHLVVESDLTLLAVQMPRNIIQRGCLHSLFDPGCALVKATFTQAGAVTATGPNSALEFTTNLAAASAYYDLGVITFVTGANAGVSRTVKGHSATNGTVALIAPLPSPVTPGDTFNIVPGCDKQQSTCSAKFSNLAHFRGHPYVPVPETLYDGGSVSAPAPVVGGQGVPGVGSPWPGTLPGRYTP